MKILYIASEALPYVSTGGLADVMGSLPAAVKKASNGNLDARVVLPMYSSIKYSMDSSFEFVGECSVSLSWRSLYCGIWKTELRGVTFYFIDNEYYFNRSMTYGEYDDGERFAYFGRAVLSLISCVGFIPDIVHANDWQSAAAVIYLRRQTYDNDLMRNIKILFTIHNIEYQGVYGMSILGDVFGLGGGDANIVEYNGNINLLKGAIVSSDMISTVSERYSNEILTEYYSCGLHHILRASRDKLTGIVNGIDTDYYNPQKDPEIKNRFNEDCLDGKLENKRELREICGIKGDENAPLLIMVSRLASHKGFDLVKRVLYELLSQTDITFAILGTGENEYEEFFKSVSKDFPGRAGVKLEYNKALSKQFYAGADMFLMPSKSEPCGLSQMIASRYGTVPIVRETGGLHDTIKPYNEYTGQGNGFSFANYNAHEMMNIIKYAVQIYRDNERWEKLIKNVMRTDFSWEASAKKYLRLYDSML